MSKLANTIGAEGEAFATDYLRERGFRILFNNYHTRYGEIDIIAERDGVVHCVEVKTRQSTTFGGAVESVTETKQQRLWRAITTFVDREKISVPYQGDVLTLEKGSTGWTVGWHENVIEDRADD